jgi:hypothetical protein
MTTTCFILNLTIRVFHNIFLNFLLGLLAAIDMDADYSMFELIANFSISIQLVVGCMSTVLSNGEKYHIRDFLDDASSHDHLFNNCIME